MLETIAGLQFVCSTCLQNDKIWFFSCILTAEGSMRKCHTI